MVQTANILVVASTHGKAKDVRSRGNFDQTHRIIQYLVGYFIELCRDDTESTDWMPENLLDPPPTAQCLVR
jgi:hypothetical protein